MGAGARVTTGGGKGGMKWGGGGGEAYAERSCRSCIPSSFTIKIKNRLRPAAASSVFPPTTQKSSRPVLVILFPSRPVLVILFLSRPALVILFPARPALVILFPSGHSVPASSFCSSLVQSSSFCSPLVQSSLFWKNPATQTQASWLSHLLLLWTPHLESLPQDLSQCSTLSSFKAKLKTFLFSQYFHPN